MTPHRLTERPTVPALVLAFAALACGDDGNNDSNTSDVFPTDACFHDPMSPGCETSGMSMSSGMSVSESGMDSFPTTPCNHDPQSCESTGASTSTGVDTDTDTEAGTGTGTGTDTDTDTDTDGSGTSGGG